MIDMFFVYPDQNEKEIYERFLKSLSTGEIISAVGTSECIVYLVRQPEIKND